MCYLIFLWLLIPRVTLESRSGWISVGFLVHSRLTQKVNCAHAPYMMSSYLLQRSSETATYLEGDKTWTMLQQIIQLQQNKWRTSSHGSEGALFAGSAIFLCTLLKPLQGNSQHLCRKCFFNKMLKTVFCLNVLCLCVCLQVFGQNLLL